MFFILPFIDYTCFSVKFILCLARVTTFLFTNITCQVTVIVKFNAVTQKNPAVTILLLIIS